MAANRRASGILVEAPRSSAAAAAAARARTILLSWPVLLAAILALALGLRLYNLDWDHGHHLHPDERFISLVDSGTKWPSFGAYFDTQHSPLNPNQGASYSYGTFPLFLGKAVADATGHSGFDDSYLVGRTLTALFDTGTVLLVFAIGSLLWSRRVGLLAALLSALTVLQIQLAHFWTVDPYLTFFATATLYLSVRIARSGGAASYLLCGAARAHRRKPYRGPRRGQGRSSSRALHLDRGCGPPNPGSCGGREGRARQPPHGRTAVDIFIRGADDRADLDVEAQERHELGPGVLPQLDDGRVAVLPLLGELGEPSPRGLHRRRGVDRFEVPGDLRPVLLRRVAETVAQQVDHARSG